jgi:hypothetical protein
MNTQKCTTCGDDKLIIYFSKNQKQCKECKKQYYQNNKEKIKESSGLKYLNNKEKLLLLQKQYYQSNKEKRNNYQKIYSQNIHTDVKKQKNKEYYLKNKEKIKYRSKEWFKKKYKEDETFRLKIKLHLQIIKYLHQHQNIKKLPEMLKYNISDFIKKIGSPKSNEDIDHKIPLSWFKEGTPIHVIWHLDNLQLLDKKENRSKSNHFSHPVSNSYKKIIKEYIKDKYN